MASAADVSNHFRFLGLPKELREMVYEYLMPQPTEFSLGPVLAFGVRPSCTKPDAPVIRYPISQTCRQIRKEAFYAYYSSTCFTFDFRWHKDIESARRWFACQDEQAISSMRSITFRHGSFDLEHHALIHINIRESTVSIGHEAFESCLEGKILQMMISRLQSIVDGLGTVDDRKVLTRNELGNMFDSAAMMFGTQWPERIPITLCGRLY